MAMTDSQWPKESPPRERGTPIDITPNGTIQGITPRERGTHSKRRHSCTKCGITPA